MQTIFNVLTIINSFIIGWGLYLILTAKTVGESRAKKNSVKSKNPVKAAGEFEVTPVTKTKRQTKVKQTNRSKIKKVSG